MSVRLSRWTPKQFLRSEHDKSFVCKACIKINVELYRMGYRGEFRQIPEDWLKYTRST